MTTQSVAQPNADIEHRLEVARGERFEFGENWVRFLAILTEDRICRAESSLLEMLERDSLTGVKFLDIGSGSGVFSLAARRLGARVHSFDYDATSVGCTRELRRRFFPEDSDWTIEQASALDERYISHLGAFDVVYSWGVLHHTGDMWRALDYAQRPAGPDGQLFIAIYNDMGTQTARWRAIKKTYVSLPRPVRPAFALLAALPEETKAVARSMLSLRPADYVRTWTGYGENRGMNKWRDITDWVGGYPYEAAKPDAIFTFFKRRGFSLETLRCGGGLGCNEFVFRRCRSARDCQPENTMDDDELSSDRGSISLLRSGFARTF